MRLVKAGGNWVEGERFFDRGAEIEALTERVREGTHTLLTAQRRMGKTSLVRELLRRLKDEGEFETFFVNLEAAFDPADAVADIGFEARSAQGVWRRIVSSFANVLPAEVEAGVRVPELGDLRAKLRAGVDAGNWRRKGDEVIAALAGGDRPAVLALDELPILVNRLLKGGDYGITPEGRQAADEFLSWLRMNGQRHKGGIVMIVFGSVSLEPVLQQARLSALANIFSPLDLNPWSEKTAMDCLGALAKNYGLELSRDVRRDMYRRLRCGIPQHVQRFFDVLHDDLQQADERVASLEDVERVYTNEMLGIRGQMDLVHYEGRLRMILGEEGYRAALEILTEAAINDGFLPGDAVARRGESLVSGGADPVPVDEVLHLLEHDGYLERAGDGYRFVSGLLEDWWRVRYGRGAGQ